MVYDRPMDEADGVLAGVRVLELGSFIAVPTAGRLLADFGADVVKVERPNDGDELRRWRLHGGDTSLLWRAIGRNKRSLTLDLRRPEGAEIALRLVRDSDVVLVGFRPGTLERWGLGPGEMRAVNPDAVVVHVTGFGQTGPYRTRPGFGAVAEAISGLRHVTGDPDRPPTRVGVSLADSVAGLYAVIGALLGLLRGAGGESVDVALYEAMFSLMESLVPDYDVFGVRPQRSGSRLPGVAPSNTYRATDGWVVLAGNGNAIFKRLMTLIARPDLAGDPRLAENAGRVAHQDELDAVIGDWVAQRTQAQAIDELSAAGVPSGPIYSVEEIAADPHFAERGMLERHEVRIGDEVRAARFPGVVPKLDRSPGAVRRLGPELGEDTAQILTAIGIGAAEQDRLRAKGII
jgi:crotonobetainyl-CoA:carnitine CoA-transferase CaiB-like acyl-CoA transferase